MQVKDLIKLLEKFDADMEVHTAYGSGDYWRTTVAPAVTQVSEGLVEYSEYHRMDQLVEEGYDEDSADEPQPAPRRVLIIE